VKQGRKTRKGVKKAESLKKKGALAAESRQRIVKMDWMTTLTLLWIAMTRLVLSPMLALAEAVEVGEAQGALVTEFVDRKIRVKAVGAMKHARGTETAAMMSVMIAVI